MKEIESVRLDKWLWSVRLYKNRAEATSACSGNDIKVDDQVAKPSRTVRVGMVVDAKIKGNARKFKITRLAEKPVGNDKGNLFYEDLSDPELLAELEKQREHNYLVSNGIAPRQPKADTPKVQKHKQTYLKDKKGKATKKERRDRDKFFEY